MVRYIIYGIYNLLYQVFLLWFLAFAAMYLNSFLIPKSLFWREGKIREDFISTITQATISLIEAALLILLIYFINKWFLSNIAKSANSIKIANLTAVINIFITLIFIGLLIYVSLNNVA